MPEATAPKFTPLPSARTSIFASMAKISIHEPRTPVAVAVPPEAALSLPPAARTIQEPLKVPVTETDSRAKMPVAPASAGISPDAAELAKLRAVRVPPNFPPIWTEPP